MFDQEVWTRAFKANTDRAEANQLMDSGYSAAVAQDCTRCCSGLLHELVVALAESPTEPEDFFDRPWLVALQEAARFACPTPSRSVKA